MKRFIALAAATTAAVLPTAAFADPSGTLSATAEVPYACDITVPTAQGMVVDEAGTSATKNGAIIGLSQNGDTDYSVTALTITEPDGATTSGSITVKRASGNEFVTATDNSDEGTVTGVFSENGTVDFLQTETVLTAFMAGDYALQTTITCEETPEPQP
jgi:hypothetical protein